MCASRGPVVVSVLTALALAGCLDESWCEAPKVTFDGAAPCPQPVRASPWTPPAPGDFLTLDDELGVVATRVPGFGGLYWTDDDLWHAYLLEPTPDALAAVREALADLRHDPSWLTDARRLEGVRGQYDYLQLIDARLQLESNLSGWSWADIDETSNRVQFAWYDPTVPKCAGPTLAALGLDQRIALTPYSSPVCAD